jgi:hypothetical protein
MKRSKTSRVGLWLRLLLIAVVVPGLVLPQEATTMNELVSKRFDLKDRVTMTLDMSTGGGLRLDSVHFKMPTPRDDRLTRSAGLLTADVAVSNTSSRSLKAGLGIALFDDEGRMLAVASGGKLTALKPERQKTFTLLFDGVNAEAHKATTFQISLESKP